MNRRIILIVVLFALFFLSVKPSSSIPKKSVEPVFSDITVTSSTSHLLFFAMLKNSFTEEMVQGLHSGLPIHFSFFIELNPTENNWNGNFLASLKTQHTISYDTLKEIYKVEIEESGKRFYTFQSLAEAQKSVNDINGLKIIEIAKLKPETSYTVRIRAELYKKTLPMGLHEVVPFVSWWDISTKWYSASFNI